MSPHRPDRLPVLFVLLRANPAVQLHWRHWDRDWIVFDEASGNTHAMGELAACALLCLDEGAMDAEALIAEVATATSLPPEMIQAGLKDEVAQLVRLALVDIVPA